MNSPRTFASLTDLLAAFNGDTKKLLGQACLLRVQPDGSIFMVPDTFRGQIDLPQGADIAQVMTSPDGSDVIGNDGISDDFVQALLSGFTGDDYKVYRLGSSARSGLTRYDGVNKSAVDIETNGQMLLRDDYMAPVVVKVAFNKQQGETLTVSGPVAKQTTAADQQPAITA
jgi:hypothetical protein